MSTIDLLFHSTNQLRVASVQSHILTMNNIHKLLQKEVLKKMRANVSFNSQNEFGLVL